MIYLIFLISILIHEFSHILVGIFFGYKVKNFKFLPFGAYIEFKEHYKIKKQILKNCIIYLMGPISNFLISLIFVFYNFKYSEQIVYINFILGIFNLLPIIPLDGSKILREILINFFDNKRSNIYSYRVSKILLCLSTFIYSILIIKIKNISLFIVLLYLWYIDHKEEKKLNTVIKAYKIIEKTNIKY